MNGASKELCQELYELSGWENKEFVYYSNAGVVNGDIVHHHKDVFDKPNNLSAYTLGYLLRKLPVTFTRGIEALPLLIMPRRNFWYAFYGEQYIDEVFLSIADTPEDAAAKLAIALIKAGIIQGEK